jgi:hypothetical protein
VLSLVGNYYWELTVNTLASKIAVGYVGQKSIFRNNIFLTDPFNNDAVGYDTTGQIARTFTPYGFDPIFAPYGNDDTVGLAFTTTNPSTGFFNVWFRVNTGHWNNDPTADPVLGINGIQIGTSVDGGIWPAWSGAAAGDQATANFGATTFVNPPPTGFIGVVH